MLNRSAVAIMSVEIVHTYIHTTYAYVNSHVSIAALSFMQQPLQTCNFVECQQSEEFTSLFQDETKAEGRDSRSRSYT